MSVKKNEKLLIIHGYSDGPQSFKDLFWSNGTGHFNKR